MARQEVGYNPSTEVLRPTVSPNFQMVQPQSAESRLSENKAFQLADALGSANATMQKFNQEYEARKTEEQARKIPAYIEQFAKDKVSGAVSQAQVRERFPETVPVIAARIAEAMGDKAGEDAVRGIMSEVMTNDSLKLDAEARAKFIEEQKQQYLSTLEGKGNEFYSSGFLKSFDGIKNQYESQFMQQTATYHNKVLEDKYTKDVENILLNGGDLEQLDAIRGTSSSINNVRSKELIVDTARNVAINTNDPSVLDKIPQKLLNADLKEKIAQTRTRVTDLRWNEFSRAEQFKEIQRKESIKQNKVQILGDLANGKPIDIAKYKDDPELFEFAKNARSTPIIDETFARRNTEQIRDNILNASTFGNQSREAIEDIIIKNEGMNYADKVELLKELPKLLDGRNLMKDDSRVTGALSLRINPMLESLEKGYSYKSYLANGINPRQLVMNTFQQALQSRVKSYYEENKELPRGFAFGQIVDDATKIAEEKYNYYADSKNLPSIIQENKAEKAKAKTPAAPATSTPSVQGKTKVEKKLPDGTIYYEYQ